MRAILIVLDSVGIKYRRKFDPQFGRPEYAPKLGYTSSHTLAIAAVPPASPSMLSRRFMQFTMPANQISVRM